MGKIDLSINSSVILNNEPLFNEILAENVRSICEIVNLIFSPELQQ
jgi:hypothetical protein